MTEQQALEDAKAAVTRNCVACDPPELTEADIESVLANARAASFWAAGVFVQFGALICATSDGTRYRVIQAGVTGTTEPDWSVFPPLSNGTFIVDGDAVLQPTVSQKGIYDISGASAAGWHLKAAKAATLTATSSAGQSAQLNQVRTGCMEMAATFQQQGVA